MNLLWFEKKRGVIVYVNYLILIFSIFFSKFLLSVSMIALLVFALIRINENGRFIIHPSWTKPKLLIKENKNYLSLCLLFLIVVMTLIHSENLSGFFWQFKLKLPFLLLPLAFLTLPALSKKQYYGLYYFLLVLIAVSSIFVLQNYFSNFDEITEGIKQGKPIPTPIDHIKFSLAVAIAVIAGIVFIIEKFFIKYRWERIIIVLIALFLFVFIHILSTRSGLATMYAAILVLMFRYFLSLEKKRPIIIALLLFASTPFLAYKFIPSFKNKLSYMLWDLKMYNQGSGEHYSDTGRILSIKVGLHLAKAHPILGVGFGDIRDESKLAFEEKFGYQSNSLLPHNEYITILAASGIVGLLLFLFGIIWPLIYNRAYEEPLLLCFSLIFWVSFMVENTIERSYSIGMFLLFTLVAIHYIKSIKLKEESA